MTAKYRKKIAILFLVTIFGSVSPIYVKQANALFGIGDIVYDPVVGFNTGVIAANTAISAATNASLVVKEYGLDSVIWVVVNLIIERMTASTVNWINSGFKGKPMYVTNPESYFADIGDKVAGQYIFSNPNLNFLCGPISAKVRLALTQNYIQDNRQWQCTLTQVGRNFNDFMGDFSKGGWDNFFELTQKQQNNPIGAFLQAENELNLQIATRQGIAEKKLNWGNGFLSFEVCGPEGRDDEGDCIGEATIATPGSVIEQKLNDVLNIGNDKLAVADEFNEIVSALLNQLISQVVGGIGGGLRGLSSGSSSNSNQSFTDKLSNTSTSSITDYFGTKVDTSILDTQQPKFIDPIISPVPDACNPSSSSFNPLDPTCDTGNTTQ